MEWANYCFANINEQATFDLATKRRFLCLAYSYSRKFIFGVSFLVNAFYKDLSKVKFTVGSSQS